MKEHQKHAKLTKSISGTFGNNEIAILGTPCGSIKELSYFIINELSGKLKISYVDADHKSADNEEVNPNSALTYGASMEFTDKINFHRFDHKLPLNDYEIKSRFLDDDLVLVNGNHFDAQSQIAVIDAAKPLQKKLQKLTNVRGFLLKGDSIIPDYLKEHVPDFESIPIFHWDEKPRLVSFIRSFVQEETPELRGLILAGGKSSRMKKDKALLHYHDKNQIEHTFNLLNPFCKEVFVSCPSEQNGKVPAGLPIIEDSFLDLGPFGALLSAFKLYPKAAWLVVACDLPLLDSNTLQYLVNNRNSSAVATAFLDSNNEFPEPLVTIWEPKAYFKLLYFLGLGYSCPRKVLINSECHLLEAPDVSALQNINYPEEFEAIKAALERRG